MKTSLTSSLLLLVVLAGCAQKDTTAPPAPRVHPVQSPTSRTKVVLTGAAEFGATVTISGGKEPVTVGADAFTAEWLAEVNLETTIPSGAVSVTNTLRVTATDAAGNVSEATTVEVKFGPEPGVPAMLSFMLTGAAAGGTITAGTDVTYSYTVTDAYGGPVDNPLQVIPSDPNTTVFDDGISGTGLILGFQRAGRFTITARASGAAGVSQQVPLTVNVAAGQRFVDLGLTLTRMATGDTTSALTVVKDVFGNVIIDDANGLSAGLTLSCTPQNMGTPATACTKMGNNFTITRAGVYRITATYDDGTNPAASNAQYVFAEDAPDVEPPVATITSIVYPTGASQIPRNTNARIEVAIDFADNKALATATLYAIFGNNPACISNSGLLLLTGRATVTTNASVRVPNCAFPFDSIGLFASVTDEAANQGFSSVNTMLTISGAGLGNVAGQGGYTLGVVAVGGGTLQQGNDVAWDGAAQIAYVPSANNQRLGAMLPDRTQQTVRDITGQQYQANNGPNGIAVTPAGELFTGRFNNGNIVYIPPTLPVNPPSLVSGLIGPARLIYDARPTTPVLCATRTNGLNAMNCYVFNAATPSLTANFPTHLVPSPMPTGNNQDLAGAALGAQNAGSFTLWLLYGGCALYSTSTSFNGTNPANPALLTVTPALPTTCVDVAALPSGDVAVLTSTSVVRVTAAGASSPMVTGLNQPAGLDFAGGQLFVLDTGSQSILRVSAPATAPF
ncbi:MAG: hypothetical protein Q8L48_30970 [Archangium sp.]|nr:hypothetical protein [Archangium sp.]